MHPGMSWWTERSIGWFERASAACDYHRQLVSVVEKYLRPGDRIVEFGCGLGYEAQILHEDGYDIRAYDKSPEAIREAEKRTGLDIYHCTDADDVDDKADVLLCINFGHLETEDDFRRLAVKDFTEALKLFRSREFYEVLKYEDKRILWVKACKNNIVEPDEDEQNEEEEE